MIQAHITAAAAVARQETAVATLAVMLDRYTDTDDAFDAIAAQYLAAHRALRELRLALASHPEVTRMVAHVARRTPHQHRSAQ